MKYKNIFHVVSFVIMAVILIIWIVTKNNYLIAIAAGVSTVYLGFSILLWKIEKQKEFDEYRRDLNKLFEEIGSK